MNGRPWTDAEKAQMAELLRAGKTLTQVAAELGRPAHGVRSQHRKDPELRSIVLRSKNGFADGELLARMLDYHAENPTATAADIAKAIGCRSSYVRSVASKRGLDIAKGRPWGNKTKSSKSNVVRLPKANAAGAAKPLTPIAAPAPPTPRLRVVNDIPAMVEEWLAQNGARKFGKGESADHQSIRFFLQDRGYELSGWQGKFRISKGAGRPKVMTWRAVLEFVDELRLAEGLQPILVRAA